MVSHLKSRSLPLVTEYAKHRGFQYCLRPGKGVNFSPHTAQIIILELLLFAECTSMQLASFLGLNIHAVISSTR